MGREVQSFPSLVPMLLRHDVLNGIESGRIEAVYRRWERPRVNPGSKLRTAVGLIEVLSVEEVAPQSLDSGDARAAGFDDLDTLLESAGDRGRNLYRVRLRHAGPDPRVTLRETIPNEAEVELLRLRLARLDAASRHGPWTVQTLRLIGESPGVRAEDLAGSVGREKQPFKLDVRKLKELGLTESLEIGYRLSPRGKAILDRH